MHGVGNYGTSPHEARPAPGVHHLPHGGRQMLHCRGRAGRVCEHRAVSAPQPDLVPIGPGRWQRADGRLFVQAYDGNGRPMHDTAGNPIVEPSSTGLGVEPAGQQVAPPPLVQSPAPRRRFWQRTPRAVGNTSPTD